MKKTEWTDRMLAALVELYPVETTAYTAAVLNLSESTVKLKARELGLVKMAKSRWMERADYIRNHFQECSFSEIGKALGITRMSVGRIAAALGLKNLYITFNGYYPEIGAKMTTCSFKETRFAIWSTNGTLKCTPLSQV